MQHRFSPRVVNAATIRRAREFPWACTRGTFRAPRRGDPDNDSHAYVLLRALRTDVAPVARALRRVARSSRGNLPALGRSVNTRLSTNANSSSFKPMQGER